MLLTGADYLVLLVNQRETKQSLSSDQEYWTFAKGTPENGETPIDTAIRETREEVGIVFQEVQKEPTFTSAYRFEQEGKEFDKKVTYFLGFADDSTFSIQEKEIKEAKWFSIEDARAQLTFEHSRLLLDEVSSYLENLDK